MVSDRRPLAPVLVMLVVLLAGCGVFGSGGTPTPNAKTTATPTPTVTPTPNATATPTPTLDGTPTPTSSPLPTPTKVSPTGVRVVTIHERGDRPNEEYIVIKNTGNNLLDLSGWSVKDGDGHVHTFADGVTLKEQQTLTLYTGQGSQTPTRRYWWADGMVWDDDGEKIRIFDETGQKVYERSYE